MTDISELAQRMKAAAEKATQGEWWADEVKNEGCYGSGDDCVEGFTSYAIYGSDGQTLFDSLNSDAACISEEYDGEGHVAWDETAQRNAEFIALANPANVRALVEALEKTQQRIAENCSPLLRAFYVAYRNWLLEGARYSSIFSCKVGLCANGYDFFRSIAVNHEPLLEELHAAFTAAGLDEKLPFNDSPQHFEAESARGECHLNPARIAWVSRWASTELPEPRKSADLEIRTVRLPKERSATEFLFPVAVYPAQELTAALTAQGIKVEAE